MTRLYCILARAADRAVVFRRGPSKSVALIGWDTRNDTFEPGQWFKGRIYERRSDLSPDGTKLVYFAAKHRGEVPTWTAVSKPPFLTALVLWPGLGTWNGISLFETDTLLALATLGTGSGLEPAEGFAVPRQLRVRRKPWPGYFCRLEDHERLVRDGWVLQAGDPVFRAGAPERSAPERSAPATYRKPIAGSTRSACLQLSAAWDGAVSHAVRDELGAFLDLGADWADVHGKGVVCSQGGKLLRIAVGKSGKHLNCAPPVELADFSSMGFKGVVAPPEARRW